MEKNWIEFYNNLTGKKLCRISIEGSSIEEIESTVGLLAYENDIKESDIIVKQA